MAGWDLAHRITARKDSMNRTTLTLIFSTLLTSCSATVTVYFSPDDKPEKHLLRHLSQAQTRIHAAVYSFTNAAVARALIAAHDRGVIVQVISDETCMLADAYHKAAFLREQGIELLLYPHKKSGIMHNKFALIDDEVWTGSMNWSRSGCWRNQENCLVCDETAVLQRYEKQFKKLKQRCFPLPRKKKQKAAPAKGLPGLLGQLKRLIVG
jgi:phosphatidylserine/phosphatidylglycerophosphate/cardiolipin synthase-like enzyme